MNNSTNLNIRIDKNVKETSEKVFEDLGLNMTTAINMFLRILYLSKNCMENASGSPHGLSLVPSFQARGIHNYTHHQPATQPWSFDHHYGF